MTRYATSDDIPEIVRIINSAFRVEDFFVKGDRTNERDIALRMADPDVRFLVIDADDSGALAGAVIVDVHGRRGHFAMLSVDPPLQGRGIARVLMNAVEEYCRAAGCESLELDVVNLREELPAFYEALGFAPVDTAPFPDTSKLRRDAHMLRMTKSLEGIS
ncbi:MAG TPA: GNAT family N-acetyltransferase [Gemmatimonadaceae bacterium]